ncbi:MAG: DNA polymerase III subunit beta [Acidimicrobiia bacterium]
MHIRADRDDLADAFGRASRAVGTRAALPILSGVFCRVSGSSLAITGTDLDITVRTSCEVESLEEGAFVVPAKLVTEAIRKMPAGQVTLRSDGQELVIEGRGPRFAIRELPVDEFPDVPEPDLTGGVDVPGDLFADAIKQVVTAASVDSARPVLTGVQVEDDEAGLRLVATDSYRLAVRTLAGVSLGGSGLIPARALREVPAAIGADTVTVAIGDREAAFGSSRGTVTVRLIEGSFPDYRRLLPESYPNRVVVDRSDLLEALGRAGLVAEDHIPVRLKLSDGGVDVEVTRQDVGGEVEHIDGVYSGDDGEVLIAFNPRYLGDGIGAIGSDEIEIQVRDGQKPSIIRGSGDDAFLYLLMPIRI